MAVHERVTEEGVGDAEERGESSEVAKWYASMSTSFDADDVIGVSRHGFQFRGKGRNVIVVLQDVGFSHG